jgi:cysteine desulfurase
MIYLDYAAATPIDPEVLELMRPYFAEQFFNPSATYLPALKTKQALEASRGQVAHWLGAKSSEIIFTAGATEANNLAIHGVMQRYPGAKVLVSSVEHESVLAPAKRYDYEEINVKTDGRLDLDDLEKRIDDQTVLVSVMLANNEIGTIEPIREVSRIINAKKRARKSNLPLYLHSDCAQAANYLDLHATRLGLDLMSLNGGKIYGPKQSGALYVRSGIDLVPLIQGGGQERGLRSGTENVAACVGLAAALTYAQTVRGEETKRLLLLQARLIELLENKISHIEINGSRKYRLPNNVHFLVDGLDNERLLFQLDTAGIMASAGSACSASAVESSHVLRSIGKSDDQARSSIRLSLGRQTAAEQIDTSAGVLADLINSR